MLNDTTKEIEELQNELWMKRTTQERAEFMFGMFATARRMIINSLPKDLPAQQIIGREAKQLASLKRRPFNFMLRVFGFAPRQLGRLMAFSVLRMERINYGY